MPFVQLPDFLMYYVVRGDGPETVLLIHGNIASARWWDKFLANLPRGYQAVAMDLRGCGKSGKPARGYTICQFAEDIRDFTEQTGLKKFHLVGHSMGGQIAAYFTLQYPKLVKTLTLVDAVPATGLDLDEQTRGFFKILLQDKAALRQAMDACMQYAADKEAFAALAWQDAANCAPKIYQDNPKTMHDTVLIDRIGSITAPVLIVHGREDLVIPLAAVESTIAAMPAAQVVVFDRCGHSPQLEIPELFTQTYFQFVAKNKTQEVNQ